LEKCLEEWEKRMTTNLKRETFEVRCKRMNDWRKNKKQKKSKSFGSFKEAATGSDAVSTAMCSLLHHIGMLKFHPLL